MRRLLDYLGSWLCFHEGVLETSGSELFVRCIRCNRRTAGIRYGRAS